MSRDWPTAGRALMHETGCGFYCSDMLRADYRDEQGPIPRRTFGCLDAAETVSAGSHEYDTYCSSGLPSFIFR